MFGMRMYKAPPHTYSITCTNERDIENMGEQEACKQTVFSAQRDEELALARARPHAHLV